jgi:hypothetical protein
VSAESARRVTPAELLDRREEAWSRRLRGSSLVCEVDVREEQAAQVASVLGHVYRKWLAKGFRPERFFTKWPACIAVAITGIAARRYHRGELWPEIWDTVRHPGGTDDQAVWGRGFAAAVDRLGMPSFPGMPMPYIGPILMHTGIPTFCLEDYFRLLEQRRRLDRRIDAESFLAWATRQESRLYSLDMPARRFLQHGTEFALDFVDRSFDLLDRLHAPAPDLEGVGLPPRVIARAQQLVAEGALAPQKQQTQTGGRVRSERPRIALEPFGHGVEVVLPAVSDAPDGLASWTITADGVTTTVRSRAEWVGAAEAAPATTFSLLKPVRTAVVSLEGWLHQTELQVVDTAAPMLVFGEDGRMLPASMPLPPDVVWVVHPEERELTADGKLTVIIEGQLPLGWNGWRLRQISLEGAQSLGLAGLPASRRAVRGHTRPRIVTGEPVPGITTPYGSPVHSRFPDVWLPGQEGADTTWSIDVRRVGSDERLVSSGHTISSPLLISDIADALPHRPVLGAFDIVVRGPLGRGAKRTVFVAEGVRARFTPAVRLFGPAGLADGKAELSAAIGAQAIPKSISFGPGERAAILQYRTNEEIEQLVVSSPHLQVMHERVGEAAMWRAGTVKIPSDVFADEPGVLLVRVPGAELVHPLRVAVCGRAVQDLHGKSQEGTARFDLVRIADTIIEHQRAELLLEVGRDVVRVATVQPRRLATAVERGDEGLALVGHVPLDGLTAAVYAVTAPWREPLIRPVTQAGSVALPDELRDAGPLLVMLQVDDEWALVDWPRWPDRYLTVSGDGHVVSGDPEETALARFISGEGEPPREIDGLWRVWTMVDLAEQLRNSADLPWFRQACSRPLLSRPAAALAELVALRLEPARTVVCLISSGLAAAAVPDDPGRARTTWPIAPVAAVLMGGLDDEDCRGAAERQCGETFGEILTSGIDPHAGVGRFGREVDRLVHMSPQQIEGIWRAANVVPQALLDADTRASAARRLFDARDVARPVGQMAAYAVKTAADILTRAGRAHLISQLDQRKHPDDQAGWRNLPAASVAFALIARLAARGDGAARNAEQTFRADWTRLATVAPDLVTIDLVLAELLLRQAKGETP